MKMSNSFDEALYKFFTAFNIGTKDYCEREYIDLCIPACPLYKVRKEKPCPKYKECFPKMTDSVYLKLICVHQKYINQGFYATDTHKLKQEVLDTLVEFYTYREDWKSKKIYEDVRAVFGISR